MRTDEADLIAALATGRGPGAIAVMRMSGPAAEVVLRRFVVGLPATLEPRRLVRATVVRGGEPLDDVLVASFHAPASYTGEDVVEVQCHGGVAIALAVEECALAAGARRARAGEFTQRAVANGKLDLLDVEALGVLLLADDRTGLDSALESKRSVAKLKALQITARATLIEARGCLDYPLQTQGEAGNWRDSTQQLSGMLSGLVDGPGTIEQWVADGPQVVFLGPPNAGKSTLFNALLGEERALTDVDPGTTRDAQPATVIWRGRRLTLIDTAGIRRASGLEGRGVERALLLAAQADVCIWVEDGGVREVMPPPSVEIQLRLLCKADLPRDPSRGTVGDRIAVSVWSGEGLEQLRQWIEARTDRLGTGFTSRQLRLLRQAEAALAGAGAMDDSAAREGLETAARALDELTDSSGVADIEVYGRFCVGK